MKQEERYMWGGKGLWCKVKWGVYLQGKSVAILGSAQRLWL